MRILDETGSTTWLSGNIVTEVDENGKARLIRGTVVDITRLKKTEEKLFQQATTGSLTGLHNRRRFFEICRNELNRVRRNGNPMVRMNHCTKPKEAAGIL